jgi:hypothetical protein
LVVSWLVKILTVVPVLADKLAGAVDREPAVDDLPASD